MKLISVGCALARNVARQRAIYIGLLLAACLPVTGFAASPRPDVIVAADGTGQYTSLQEAISAAPMKTDPATPRWVIFVKAGTYRERIYVQRERGNIHVLGEDREKTVVVYNQHANIPGPDGKPIGTFRTPTVQIDGDGMIWENLTLANDAGRPGPRPEGPAVSQALALRADGDRLEFRGVRFLGWQDTILVNRGRHYFKDCYIEGHVDFIFGDAKAFFDRCHIHGIAHQSVMITAQSKNRPDQDSAYVFDRSLITADPKATGIYFGRAWRPLATVIFMRSRIEAPLDPAGWREWTPGKTETLNTAYFAEYASTGPGASPKTREPRTHQLTDEQAKTWDRRKFLTGSDGWKP